jgi:very-short-patch-repair endonuclease
MRKSSTDAETKLWMILRSRLLSGYKFRRQHRMARYILDFYSIKQRLAIELDGGQHTEPKAIDYDIRRTARLEELGVRVLRFSDLDMLKHADVVAETILENIQQNTPHPRPLPAYRERGSEK